MAEQQADNDVPKDNNDSSFPEREADPITG